ncbi:MAG: triphosphoribosyl-dephospho-CoA synthase CitG, partial [Cetobacterium sp.]
IIQSLEGKTYLFNIDIDSSELKKIAMEIEESHPLGRCVDIDIFNEESKLLSRTDFGFSKRKCFICDELAFVCGRSFTHSHEEIKLNIRNRYENYIKIKNKQEQYCDLLADFALKGIILEVSSSPSFGLVSPLTQGSHSDMNFFTFLNSSFAIKPFLKEMSLVGYSSLSIDTIFKKIRIIGISAEENMFSATKGINTHKGMIFLMGISLASVSKAIYENLPFNAIADIISEMCKDILKDFEALENKENLTHGEKLYLNYGITGIRGEVKEGLKNIFTGSLNILENSLKKDSDINKAMIQTLLFLMSVLDDSTILHRHDFKTLEKVKNDAKNILDIGGVYSENGLKAVNDLEKEYIKKRISPGGSADSLAVTLFLKECRDNFF